MPGRSVGLAPRKINLGTTTIARVFAEWVAVRSPAPHPSAKPSSLRNRPWHSRHRAACASQRRPMDRPLTHASSLSSELTLAPIKRARPTQAVTFSRQAAVTHLSDVPLERPEPLMCDTPGALAEVPPVGVTAEAAEVAFP